MYSLISHTRIYKSPSAKIVVAHNYTGGYHTSDSIRSILVIVGLHASTYILAYISATSNMDLREKKNLTCKPDVVLLYYSMSSNPSCVNFSHAQLITHKQQAEQFKGTTIVTLKWLCCCKCALHACEHEMEGDKPEALVAQLSSDPSPIPRFASFHHLNPRSRKQVAPCTFQAIMARPAKAF
jgi:hypothetical protein